jgi:hypothetical protein
MGQDVADHSQIAGPGIPTQTAQPFPTIDALGHGQRKDQAGGLKDGLFVAPYRLGLGVELRGDTVVGPLPAHRPQHE